MRLRLLLAASLLAPAWIGCGSTETSTETGNPIGTQRPSSPLTSALTVNLGLRPEIGGMGVQTAGVGVARLWLNLSDIEFLGCAGVAKSNPVALQSNLQEAGSVEVEALSDDVCGIVVRTQPLEASPESGLPDEAVGAGALVEGMDALGVPVSLLLPPGVFSVMTPDAGPLSLSELSDVTVVVDTAAVLADVSSQNTSAGTFTDMASAPEVVTLAAAELNRAFSLVAGAGTSAETSESTLATSVEALTEAEDLLCLSNCNRSLSLGCQAECDPAACMTAIADAQCGAAFSPWLHCLSSVSGDELSCSATGLSSQAARCLDAFASYQQCTGG